MALFHPKPSEDRQFMLSVYNEYIRLMYFTARKYVPEPDRQNDVVQESLLRLVRNVPTLRGLEPQALSTYIVTTVKNTAVGYAKREEQMREQTAELSDGSLTGLEAPEPPLDDLMAAAEDRERLRTALENLPENERLLLERKYFLGHSDRELAKFFQCKPRSIRMKLTRARRHLVSLLQSGKECDGDDES